MKWGFLCLLILLSLPSFSQGKYIKIENADSLIFDETESDFKRLIGHVRINHDGTIMTCDSAHIKTELNFFHGFGHVVILKGDSIKGFGDEVIYEGNKKYAKLIGRARLIKNDITVSSEILHFNETSQIAYWLTNGKIIQDGSVLTSKKGYYNTKSDYFTFRDSIYLKDKDYELWSDSLGLDQKTKLARMYGPTKIISGQDTIHSEKGHFSSVNQSGEFKKNVKIYSLDQDLYADSVSFDQVDSTGHAIGNVRIWDKKENLWILGEDAFQDHKTGKGIVFGKTELQQVFETDTMFLHSDTMKFEEVNGHKEILAFYNVKFFKEDLQGKCDSMQFSFVDSLIKMNGSPILWADRNQITGDTILIQTYDQKIQKMFINRNSFMISEIDSSRFNQIKGKRMIAYFKKNKMDKLDVLGNGQTIYWAEDKDKKLIGVNNTVCSKIRIYMKDNEINTITFLQKPSSTFSPPMDKKPEELKLENFRWEKDQRPKNRWDIF